MAQCNKGHDLLKSVAKVKHCCDNCSKEIVKTAIFYICGECDFDLCPPCYEHYNELKIQINDTEDHGKAPPKKKRKLSKKGKKSKNDSATTNFPNNQKYQMLKLKGAGRQRQFGWIKAPGLTSTSSKQFVLAVRHHDLINADDRNELCKHVVSLENTVKQFRDASTLNRGEKARIHDLVDPCLHCNWYHNDLVFKEKIEAKEKNSAPSDTNDNSFSSLGSGGFGTNGNSFSSGGFGGFTFGSSSSWGSGSFGMFGKPVAQWIPTEFDIGKNKFTSEINNLSFIKYGNNLYPVIANIFQQMIPMFECVTKEKLSDINNIQLIVKLQNYEIEENGNYEGEFHREGLPEESIIAVGIYYYDIDNSIEGGDLSLETDPNNTRKCLNYGIYLQRKEFNYFTINNIQTGNCIVFSNIDGIYHKLNKLHGYGKRKILAFFLVDPNKMNVKKSSHSIIVNWDDVTLRILNKWEKEDLQQLQSSIPDSLRDLIVSFVIGDEKKFDSMRDNTSHSVTMQFTSQSIYKPRCFD